LGEDPRTPVYYCAQALTLAGVRVANSHQADSSINQNRYTGASVCVRSAIVWSMRRQDGSKGGFGQTCIFNAFSNSRALATFDPHVPPRGKTARAAGAGPKLASVRGQRYTTSGKSSCCLAKAFWGFKNYVRRAVVVCEGSIALLPTPRATSTTRGVVGTLLACAKAVDRATMCMARDLRGTRTRAELILHHVALAAPPIMTSKCPTC